MEIKENKKFDKKGQQQRLQKYDQKLKEKGVRKK